MSMSSYLCNSNLWSFIYIYSFPFSTPVLVYYELTNLHKNICRQKNSMWLWTRYYFEFWIYRLGYALFLSVLCLSALSLCCGSRKLPFKRDVSFLSLSWTFILELLVINEKRVSILLLYSCSYLHGLECEYCGNKCLHPFDVSQQEGI